MDSFAVRRWGRLAQLCAGAALLLLGTPSVKGQDSPPLPAGVEPASEELDQRIRGLVEKAEKQRGLKSLRPVAAGTVGVEALRIQIVESMRRQLDPARLGPFELGLKAFGLLPESMSLARFLPELMSSQVAGYYDPERKYLALVRRPPPILGEKPAPAEGEQKEEEMVVVHELVHALQDQHFDLRRFENVDPYSDESAAGGALVEGDATAAMLMEGLAAELAIAPGADRVMRKVLDDPEMLRQMADLPGGKALFAAPAYLREGLLFNYLQGFLFTLSVRRAGGQPLLDYAFSTDPPRSTEQILHPEKWYAGRDDPIELRLPDLAGEIPGFAAWASGAAQAEGELGEWGVRLFLRERSGDRARADRAAEGWGGDRFAVLAQGADRRLVWLLDWDTERDAEEFLDAAGHLGWGWRTERLAPNRVVVLRGSWGRKERAALFARLLPVEGTKPANRRIDFAAIGAKPALAAGGEQMVAEIKALASSGAVSEDGGSYRDAAGGYSIALPSDRAGWSFSPGGADQGVAITLVNERFGGVVLVVRLPPLPAGEAESEIAAVKLAEFFELGMSSTFDGYRRIGGRDLKDLGDRAFTYEFRGRTPEGAAMSGVVNVALRGPDAFVFVGLAPEAGWKRAEPAIREILRSVRLFAPVVPPEPLVPGGAAGAPPPPPSGHEGAPRE